MEQGHRDHVIPDPARPERFAIRAADGALMVGVFTAPPGTPPTDRAAWRHTGWTVDDSRRRPAG